MKYLWQIYYFFFTEPNTQSEKTLKWCRTNGKPYDMKHIARLRALEHKKLGEFDE